jgi:hypothetical protein
MTDKAIEAAARAICRVVLEADGFDPSEKELDHEVDSTWHEWTNHARVAIAAYHAATVWRGE